MFILYSFLFFFIAVFAGRFLFERSLKKLTDSEKARFLDGFSFMRMWSFLPIVLIVVVGFIVDIAAYIFPIIVIYILAIMAWSFFKLKQLNLPKEFIRDYAIGRLLILVSLGILIFSSMTLPEISDAELEAAYDAVQEEKEEISP